mgnify:CR=1 FL=1
MRTKLVLMAMALPALFAACTSDEFVEPAQGDFNGRALLNGLTVNIDQNAETRFAWGDYQWKFETGDKFGAGVTDYTKLGQIEDAHLLGNYIFSKSADGSYKTTSQMYEGTYFFYSYPGFEGKATRDLIKFDLGVQKADLTKPEEVINNTQLFFSPLYDIKAETVGTPLPLKFYPYWSVAAFKIKNNTGKAFKISQIVLKDNMANFVTKGEISPVEINKAKLKYSIAEGESEYTLPKDVKYDEAMATGDFVKTTTKVTSTSIALNCDNYELANGKEIIAYMSVPAGTQTNLEAEIIVNVEGVSKKIEVTENGGIGDPATTSKIASTGISTLQFKRGQTKAVFGFETGGKTMKTLNVVAENLQDADGFYVDNKADLLAVINANRGGIEIYNMGDLAIDNEVAEALTLYTASGVTFSNPIEIKATGDATIDKTTFAGTVTVKSGNVTFDEGTEVGAAMKVEAGKAILAGGKYGNAAITVAGGELVVSSGNMTIKSIAVNSGTLTINGKEAQSIITSGTGINALTFENDKATTLNVDLNGDDNATKTLTVDANVTLAAKTTMNIAEGNIVAISSGKTLANEGTIVNNGTINGTGTLTNTGTIETAGTIGATAVNNTNGYIKLTDEWTSNVNTTTGAGLIDNTVGGTVNNAASIVYRVYTGEVANVNVKTGELVVFNNATLNNAIDLSGDRNGVLLLGTTDVKANLTMASTAKLQIGLKDENDSNVKLASIVTGKDLSTADKVVAYNSTIVTSVYEGVTVKQPILLNYGATSRNKGTIEYTSSGSLAGNWVPEGTFTGK